MQNWNMITRYRELEIKRTKKILKEFPELWALRREWYSFPVKICRAPAIHFLEGPICASPGMRTIKAYLVTDQPSVEDVAITVAGNRIIRVGENRVDDPDGVALRSLALNMLVSCAVEVRYIFLLEEGGPTPGKDWEITIIKPPAGERDFAQYIKKFLRSKSKLQIANRA